MKKITFVTVDSTDWTGLYIGNEIFAQDTQSAFGHLPTLTEFLEALEINYEVEIQEDIDGRLEAYLEESGELPETLREVHQIIGGD